MKINDIADELEKGYNAIEENKKLKRKVKRLETIIYSLAGYLNELFEHYEGDDNYEHHHLIFGITRKEYKKYFKGEQE